VGCVRGVSKNILPVRCNIHSYYTPSQARSQNAPPSAVISEMIEKVIQVKDEQHKQEMEERMTQQREEHNHQMEAMNAAIIEQFAAQMAAYVARFHSLEGSTVVSSGLKVTTKRAVHDLGSPVCHIIRSFVDNT
jgi:FKBP-type peptidyl-prolyl cis-trans isomerase